MAKRQQAPIAPAVSTLPLADQESPLVIDLPDGQKLVVGNIAHGTVIEVATWRGTGRPDSRTSRLMLGVSSASAVVQSQEQVSSSQNSTSTDGPEQKKVNPVKRFLSSLVTTSPVKKKSKAIDEIDQLLQDEVSISPQVQTSRSEKTSRVSEAFSDSNDIQSWLDDLMKDSSHEVSKRSSSSTESGKLGPESMKLRQTKKKAQGRVASKTGPKKALKSRSTQSKKAKKY